MSRVRMHESGKLTWSSVRSLTPPELMSRFSEAELESSVAFHESGTEDSLQLFEVRYLPGAEIELHAHQEDEIIYILAGSMIVGRRELEPGSSLFIAAETLYGFTAGLKGLHLLNFRPVKDMSFVTKEEYLANRTERSSKGAR
jgi:quercetin dioxygenase-like cupin family protein